MNWSQTPQVFGAWNTSVGVDLHIMWAWMSRQDRRRDRDAEHLADAGTTWSRKDSRSDGYKSDR